MKFRAVCTFKTISVNVLSPLLIGVSLVSCDTITRSLPSPTPPPPPPSTQTISCGAISEFSETVLTAECTTYCQARSTTCSRINLFNFDATPSEGNSTTCSFESFTTSGNGYLAVAPQTLAIGTSTTTLTLAVYDCAGSIVENNLPISATFSCNSPGPETFLITLSPGSGQPAITCQ